MYALYYQSLNLAYLLTFIAYNILFCKTCMRPESANERYQKTAKPLLLPDTVSQTDETPHTAWLYI